MPTNYVAYSISSVAETRDRALSFSREVEFMGGFPLPFSPMVFKSDTWRNRTDNPCVVSPHAKPLRHQIYSREKCENVDQYSPEESKKAVNLSYLNCYC